MEERIGAYLDLHRPLCFGRGIPFVPLPGLRFIFTQDFPVEAEIGRYYETPDYISHSDTKKGAMNSVYHRVRSYMLKRKARLVAHEAHRKTGRLLDIGTGTGYFADTMNRGGWQVEAVEKNAGARVFAKEHFGLEVKPDTALKDFEPGSFDVITCGT